jgi:hypothetical protein
VETSCERGNEPSGSIKCWETTEWLHNLWPLERYSAPQSYKDDARTSQETRLWASTPLTWKAS